MADRTIDAGLKALRHAHRRVDAAWQRSSDVRAHTLLAKDALVTAAECLAAANETEARLRERIRELEQERKPSGAAATRICV